MISNEIEYKQAKLTLDDLEGALFELKQELSESNPALYESLAFPYLKDIEKLRREIDEYTGVSLAQTEKAPFWLRLIGEGIHFGDAPAKIISDWIEKTVNAFKSALYEMGYTQDIPDLKFVAVANRSFGVGFKLPESQLEFFEQMNLPEETLTKLSLAAISLAADNPDAEMEQNFPDSRERKIFLENALNLIPSRQSPVKEVELSGRLVPKPKSGLRPHLIAELREKGDSILEKLSELVGEKEEKVVRSGWLFKVNYNNNNFWLKEYPGVKFHFETGLARKVKEALDPNKKRPQKAEVKGIRRKNVIEVLSIRRLEE
ncbi:MAG: hypothetical protein U9Q76_03265 [candidate division WOR-3 bacterium]|nr:hypothetical protein [candidate division WOR-3 bacterium]